MDKVDPKVYNKIVRMWNEAMTRNCNPDLARDLQMPEIEEESHGQGQNSTGS